MLVALQDLDEMIEEAEDEKNRSQLEAMGFPVDGLENLRVAREKLEEQVPPQLLGRYRRLLERSGRAVVPVVANSCTGCFSAIPHSFVSSTHADQVLQCEACGRILFWP
jgi:predicted  nucleic acid-binding Zn-ribbon protein